MSTEQENSTTFEQDIQQLEALVKEMESGELTLEASLAAFEKGVKLARKCQDSLTSAEVRVKKLMEEMKFDVAE